MLRRGLPLLLLVLSALALASATAVVHAQDDAVARLRARVAAAPSDAALRCQLSFALVGAGQHEEARSLATTSVTSTPRPLTPTTRRTVGACLYNLGRAEEGLGHRAEAASAYVRSLAVRDNDAVRARLAALVPETPTDLPAAALVVLDEHPDESAPQLASPAAGASVRIGPTTLHFVSAIVPLAGGYTMGALYAIAIRDDVVVVSRVDEWSHEDNGGSMRIEAARAYPARGTAEGAAVTVEGVGGGACGQMNGFMDFIHRATVLVAFDGARIRSRSIATEQHDCGDPVRVRMQLRGTDVVVSRSRGSDLAPGSYPISSLLR